jgi:DNA invertase Pin-like site-specific DNA recombinase
MANGNMGKKVPESTRLRVLELLSKGNTTSQVAQRLGISTAFVRRFQREEQERQAIDQQVPDDFDQGAEDSI